MLREEYEAICSGRELRANLIALKQELRDAKKREVFLRLTGNNLDPIMKCLVDPDAKVRKNAAALLGLMRWQDAAEVLLDAYEEEEQRFVRPAYLKALAQLDVREYLPNLRERLEELRGYVPSKEEKKHVQEEMRELRELILAQDGFQKHTFTGAHESNEVILVTDPPFVNALAEELTGKKKVLKTGVRTVTSDLDAVMELRLFRELLFVIHAPALPREEHALADGLLTSDLMELLEKNHKEDEPFYFRLGLTGAGRDAAGREEENQFLRQAARRIEEVFGGRLMNSVSHYEVELRLIPTKEGRLMPFLKLFTIPDHRFSYRRESTSASMRPELAAGLMALAAPYLKDYAQVLDPFCGVGTLLIERRYAGSVRNAYGIDSFGEAIQKARVNTKTARLQINYINRDFFRFEHDYLFDEIVTDMPSGSLSGAELDQLYGRFLEKAHRLLTPNGRIICYSREMGRIKKQLRLHDQFRLLKEFRIREKTGAYLFILEKK